MIRFSGQNLSCVRARRAVFENLSFRIDGGQVMVLTGANGSGKTSLLRVMAGLLAPVAGVLSWGNEEEMPDDALHWVGPENALKPDLTVQENLEFWLTLSPSSGGRNKVGGGTAIDSALLRLNMTHLADTPVRYLSAGQRRRAALCRLFLAPRPLWLLDEPETGLDSMNVAALRDAVRHHTVGGGMVVIATHRADLWNADIFLEMNGGGSS